MFVNRVPHSALNYIGLLEGTLPESFYHVACLLWSSGSLKYGGLNISWLVFRVYGMNIPCESPCSRGSRGVTTHPGPFPSGLLAFRGQGCSDLPRNSGSVCSPKP